MTPMQCLMHTATSAKKHAEKRGRSLWQVLAQAQLDRSQRDPPLEDVFDWVAAAVEIEEAERAERARLPEVRWRQPRRVVARWVVGSLTLRRSVAPVTSHPRTARWRLCAKIMGQANPTKLWYPTPTARCTGVMHVMWMPTVL